MKGNVQLAGEDQLDELRICVVKSFDKLRGRLNSTTAQGWIGNGKSLDFLLERMLPPAEEAVFAPKQKPRLVFLKQVALAAAPAKKTAECLVGGIYGHRDSDIDRWLPEMQPASDVGTATVYDFGEQLTFAQVFRALLKLAEDAPLDVIISLLKKRKHTLTLSQLDILVENQEKFFQRQEGGEDVGLRTDGYANFVPVKNADGGVSIVVVGRSVGRWDRSVRSLGRGLAWVRGYRLLVSNSDASNP